MTGKSAQHNRTLVLVIAAVVASSAAGWLAGRTIRSPAEEAARTAAPTPSLITVPVERRLLTEDVVTRGTVGFGSPMTVSLPASTLRSGNTIVTVPPAEDSVLDEGSVALAVSGRPVLALRGDIPNYRDLAVGARGQDVRQLEAGLARLGHDPGRQDAVFDRSTRRAVRAFFSDVGFDPGNGDVAADEVVFFPELPVRVGEATIKAGNPPDGPVMTVTSSEVTVAASLSADDAKLVREGADATLEDPERGIRAVGKVTSVATRPGTNGVEAQRFFLEIVPTDAPPALNGAAVVVSIAVRSTAAEVLAAPLAALSTSADGTTLVEIVGTGGSTRSVRVRPGLSAKGLVEIAPIGGALDVGDQVVVGAATKTASTRGADNGP